ncbi:MAG TPA: ABC transporter substrate-binding protein, partial [Acidimicrobiia bacterium]|nr:ABC transporter substrate-binding protein [Acidimicrobiia bacterium]
MTRSLLRPLALLVLLIALVAACGGDDPAGEATTLRLGYFPNVTHAPAIVGHMEGFFADALGEDVTLEVSYFNAGPEAVESLFGEALDATFIGPNPAINAYAQSNGEAIRIVAGSTSGGAFLVVRPGIEMPQDLAGATIATPQLGNTQDVALRAWLIEQELSADTAGGGDVSIV